MGPIPSILVVDDEKDHCLNLADILGEFDYAVDIAGGGAEALHLLEENSYEIALLDLAMPAMDGLALSRRIEGVRPGLPTCFITAHISGLLADEVRASRAGPILAKPLDIPKLLYWIDGAVGRRKGDLTASEPGAVFPTTEGRRGRDLRRGPGDSVCP